MKKVKGATGYVVKYSTSKKFKAKNTKKVKVIRTTVKLNKLKAKKVYYVKARAYKKVEGKTYYSSWTKAKKINK